MAQPKPGGLVMGYRFEPSDEDLIDFYLRKKKIYGDQCVVPDYLIKDLDIYQHNPDELPQGGAAFPYRHSNEMYFFTPRHPTAPSSKRVNRRAGDGLWDGHAKNIAIEKNGKVIGHKTQLHFKILADGSNKKIHTNWIMNEYCLGSDKNSFDALVLCKIYKKSEKAAEGNESASSYCAELDLGQEQQQDSERLPKRQRAQEPPPPLACIPADYQERSLPSFVSMMNEATAGCWCSSGATALLDTGNHAPTSASTIPLLMRPADCGGAFAQLPTNTPTEQSLAATGAEYQVSTEKLEAYAEPVSLNGAGNLGEELTDEKVAAFAKLMDFDPTEEPIDKDNDGNTEILKLPAFMKSLDDDHIEEPSDDDDDDDAAFAKSLEAYIEEETLASTEAGNRATHSSSQSMSLPLEGAHEPSPLTPSVGSNCGSSSAPTVPMAVVPDDHHVSAQAQVNAMSKEPSTSCHADTQTQIMGSVAGEVPNDYTSPLPLDCYDWDALVASMKDFDNTCFTIDEFLGNIKSRDVKT